MTGSAISEKISHGRNQRFVLLLADRGEDSGLAPSARQENVRLYGQGLRAHYPHQEVQGNDNSRKGFWDDLG
jgi:hypothetical protein